MKSEGGTQGDGGVGCRDLFEVFCDACYYDQWAVRPVGEKRWGHCYHLPSKEEAEGLAKELTLLAQNEECKTRLEAAEAILSDLSTGFWVATLDDADDPVTNKMGQRVLDYWRRADSTNDKLSDSRRQ